jgi:hypothetical protein
VAVADVGEAAKGGVGGAQFCVQPLGLVGVGAIIINNLGGRL